MKQKLSQRNTKVKMLLDPLKESKRNDDLLRSCPSRCRGHRTSSLQNKLRETILTRENQAKQVPWCMSLFKYNIHTKSTVTQPVGVALSVFNNGKYSRASILQSEKGAYRMQQHVTYTSHNRFVASDGMLKISSEPDGEIPNFNNNHLQ